MQDIEANMLRIHAYGKSVVIKHESVVLNDNGGVKSSRFFGGRWQRLVDHFKIAVDQPLVFTNLGNYELKMSIFTCNGTCLHTEYVLPTMLMIPTRDIPLYAIHGMFYVTFDCAS
jgi:hypothetical protein